MNKLIRPREGRMIAGVCAGLAERFRISHTAMRVLFLVSCLLPGPQFIIYLALWIVVPSQEKVTRAYSP
ncbi:MAG: PspC domain-containing protein [Stackebrandtia sp.]